MKRNRLTALLIAIVMLIGVMPMYAFAEEPTEYTVTFDSDGGTAVPAQTVEEGKKATEPTAPTKDGNTFVEWQLDGTKYDFDTVVSKNITLQAIWQPDTPVVTEYTVTFDSDGGTAVPAQTIEEGKKATAPTAPTKDGNTFVEWQLDGTKYDFDTVVSKDITLQAIWQLDTPVITKVTVTYESNGGSAVLSETVDEGTAFAEPTAPTRAGYTFKGWFTEIGLTNKYVFTTLATKDIKLYAKWEAVPALESVSISPKAITINKGGSRDFTLNIKPTNLTDVKYEWKLDKKYKDDTYVLAYATKSPTLYIADNETASSVVLSVTVTAGGVTKTDSTTVYIGRNYYDDLRITSAYRSGNYIKGRVSEPYARVNFYRDNSSSYYAYDDADSSGDFSIYIGGLTLNRNDYLVASKSGYSNSSKYYVSGWESGDYSREVYPTGLDLNRDNDRVEGRLSNYTNTRVYVYYDGSQIGSGYTDSNGYFDISLNRYIYRTGDLRFFVGSNVDTNKQVYPTNKKLNSYGDRVEGRLYNYVNTRVYVYYDGSEIGSGNTDRYGDFDISLSRRIYDIDDLKFYVRTSDDEYRVTLNRIAYIKGFPDGSFRPNANMTRAEAATMFARLLNNGDNFGTSNETIFSDSNYKWHSQAVNYVVNKGYINGYPDGTFRPDENITRAEFAQMISKYLEVNVNKSAFSDTEKHWAKDAISILYGNKTVKGYPDGSFRPDTQITRAEAVTILNSVFGRVSDTSSFANLKGYLKSFNDISTSGWYYADVMDASNAHESYRTSSSNDKEVWTKIK